MAGITGDRIVDIVKNAESRGRRYGADGGLLRSPKGALGEMQVMPATARNPGYGLKPANPSNPDDLARLGKQYLGTMMREFKGNLPQVFSAYNAGPGATQRLIEQHGDDWLRFAPRETQEYVRRNMRAVRGQ